MRWANRPGLPWTRQGRSRRRRVRALGRPGRPGDSSRLSMPIGKMRVDRVDYVHPERW